MNNLLEVKNLKTYFYREGGIAKVVDNVNLAISEAETLALVGESGCGKTMFSLSVLNLVPSPGKIAGGEILFQGKDLLKLSSGEIQKIRGKDIAMVFQEPLSSLNPLLTVGSQVSESLIYHLGLSNKEATRCTIELFEDVEMPNPAARFYDYPHQLSGGMRQRVMIAIALSCKPQLLILDEPTTALDVTIQAQILDLLAKIKQEYGMSFLLITHDLAIVSDLADRVAIMYAGKIAEEGMVGEIFSSSLHPYTRGLLGSVPDLKQPKRQLKAIRGTVPDFIDLPSGCPFHNRCDRRIGQCEKDFPAETKLSDTHSAWCYNPVNID
ncbi:MAG: ABC transporter ATP-binding protein [Candidatus Omnitrophica bacterium]|nr:ABC transporter ATP-binding protein [Candidatus Omnitrophota bacterium]